MDSELIIFITFLLAVLIFSIAKKKLTTAGALMAAVLSIILFAGTGLKGVILLATFFFIGVFVTAFNRIKQNNLAPGKEERNALQVIANGGIAAILGFTAYMFPQWEPTLLLMIAGALSSATADTVSSELGMVYGNRFYNIITFKKDQKGADGVISWEGSLFGLAGSFVIALVYLLCIEPNVISALMIILAGTAGNLADSILGATLERKNMIGNNAVNFLNTFIAAAIAGALGCFYLVNR